MPELLGALLYDGSMDLRTNGELRLDNPPDLLAEGISLGLAAVCRRLRVRWRHKVFGWLAR